MSDLVGNPEDRFSRVEAHIVVIRGKERTSSEKKLITKLCLIVERAFGFP